MAEVVLRLRSADAGARALLKETQAQIRGLGGEAEQAEKKTSKLKEGMNLLGGVIAGIGIKSLITDIVRTGNAFQGFENALTSVTGSSRAATGELNYVREVAQRLGLNIENLASDYTKLSAAAKGTSLEGKGTRDVFEAVSQAARVLNLSANDTSGALVAIQQIISKGTVSAEELRGQLGERLPGAFQIAARSINVTTEELGKMLEQGKLSAEEFLPAFAAELKKSTEAGAEFAAQSPAAEFERLNNALIEVKANIAESGLLESLAGIARTVTAAITDSEGKVYDLRTAAYQTISAVLQAFENVRGAFELLGTAAEIVFKGALQAVRDFAADSLQIIADAYRAVPFGAGNLAAEAFEKASQAARGNAEALETLGQAYERIRLETDKRKRVIEGEFDDLSNFRRELRSTTNAVEDHTKSNVKLGGAVETLAEAKRNWAAQDKLYRQELLKTDAATLKAARAMDELNEHFKAQEEAIKQEIYLLGLSGAEREREIIRLQASSMARDENGRVVEEWAARYEAALTEAADTRRVVEAFEEAEAAGLRFTDSVSSAIGDFVAGNIKSFGDFKDAIIGSFKQMIAEMVAMWIKANIFGQGQGASFGGLLSGIFGGSNGIGGGFNLGSLFGGGNSGGGGFNMGSTMPWLAAAGGALYGFRNRGNGGLSSAAAGVAYGGLGYVGATLGAGALAGAGAATAATAGAGLYATGSAAVGGAATGAMGAAAAIPIVGWIVAIAALVDMISGGKLFGTKYRPDRATQTISLGEDGAEASLDLRMVRQRSLFRGRQWTTRSRDPGDEAREAAQALFDSVSDVMTGAARQLDADVPPMIEAAIRSVSELSKKGKVKSTKIFVDVLGRTWEEATAELASTRIVAESIIATIDSAMGIAAPEIGAAIVDPIGASIGNEMERVGEFITDSFSGPTQAMQDAARTWAGEASYIAERWRGNAEQLMAGAQFLLQVATDIRHGFDLLGTGTLTPIVDLVEELAYNGETLVDTYRRLAASTQVFEQALDMMGQTLDIGREAFVRLANDIAEAAGGLDQASALWADYFNRYYSDSERAAFQLDQLRTSTAAMFEALGLNLDDFLGPNGLQLFREYLEETLPTASASTIVALLEAAQALGILTDATAQWAELIGLTTDAISASADELDRLRNGGFDRSGTGPMDPGGRGGDRGGGREGGRGADWGRSIRDEIDRWMRDRLGIGGDPGSGGTPGTPGGPGRDPVGEIDRTFDRLLQWLNQLRRFRDSLQLDAQLSILTPTEMLAEARRQYEETLAAAQAGDANAQSAFEGIARAFLQQGRAFYGSAQGYTDIFDRVNADLGSLIATNPANTAAAAANAAVQTAQELAQLRAEQDLQAQAQIAEQRKTNELLAQALEAAQQQIAELKRANTSAKVRTA